MKTILFLIMLTGISLQGYAQEEFNTKSIAIPNKKMDIKKANPPEEIKPKIELPVVEKKPDPFEINPEELFKNRSLYKEPKDSVGIYYRRNQYLGSFKTKTFASTVRFRDAAFVDGDKIKIYLNDKVIEAEVRLDGTFKEFKINLVPGINKIDFEALNEGFASPNTAQFEVYDDKGTAITSQPWNVGTGYKATIVLVKE
ncbi:hypothetical protein [Flavobacterium sp. 5]|uniref:hypothetical protein n=1 Tax=Flavobacterium sp. 5 TaxID=2035199 RepID=UPI000C2BCD63|nr:hypothetical protein [Flavobacterium sp. 5]PKB15584.1 hypothetical protein CLU82_0664 [Flavobacterium sp. 5]